MFEKIKKTGVVKIHGDKEKSEKQMMRNEPTNEEESNLINRNSNTSQEKTENGEIKIENAQAKHGGMHDKTEKQIKEKPTKRQADSETMARRTMEHMAFKSGGLPSPQLIVIKRDLISLDNFLQIRRLAIEQGHYTTAITDTSGKVGEEVLRLVDRNRPHSSYHWAGSQIEQERMQSSQANVPPSKSPRLQEPSGSQEVGEENLFDDIDEKEEETDDEVTSEVSATFDRLNTGIKNEPTAVMGNASNSATFQSDSTRNNEYEANKQDTTIDPTSLFSPPKKEPEISQGEEEMDLTEPNNIRGVSKSGRRVKQTQLYGFQVDSNMSGIFFSDHDTSDLDRNNGVQNTDSEMNPELLMRSRIEEIRGWRSNDEYIEVPRKDIPAGTKILNVRWVDSRKSGLLGTKSIKSRCVVEGNQEDATNLSTYAPIVSKEMMMYVTSISATNKWEIETMDVEKAFLQSRQLARDVFVNPPKEAVGNDRSKVWKLKTAVYGLGDATREWYLTVKKTLRDFGQRASLNPHSSKKLHRQEISKVFSVYM